MTLPAFLLAVALAPAPSASPAAAPLRGVGVEESLDADPVLAPALDQARPATGVPMFVRLTVTPSEVAGEGAARAAALDERLSVYAARKVPVVLALGPLPTTDQAESWKARLREIAGKSRGRVRAYEFATRPGVPAGELAFLLKLTTVQVRAVDADALVVAGGLQAADTAWLESLYREDVAAYLDAVAVEAPAPDALDGATALGPLLALVEREDPTAVVAVTGIPLGDESVAPRRLGDWELRLLGTKAAAHSYAATAAAFAPALSVATAVKDLLTAEVVPLDEKGSSLKLVRAGQDVTSSFPHRLLYNVGTFSTYFVYWGGPESGAAETLQIELRESAGKPPLIRDPLKGRQGTAREFLRDPHTKTSRVNVVPVPDRPLLLDFNGGNDAYVSRAEVTEGVLPSVAEIIARHQEAQAGQDALIETYVADARMEQHFRPSATDPGFDVVTDNRFYFDREGTEWEELSFTLNGSKWGANRPPFPLLQPEKVLSLPLDLRLNKDYTYKLEGVDKVGDRRAYAVQFQPLDGSRSLYRGTVWIDAESFVKLKVQAVQTQLSPPVVSSEEIQYFTPAADLDGRTLSMFTRLVGRQIMLVAGRNLLVEREVKFSNFRVNAQDFASVRAASRATNHVMFRDTERGLRYYVKKGEQRVVEDNPTTTAKALAFGVTIDPSYDFPLPIVGINYLDFEFLGKKQQLALLFGGVLALANVQHPKILGPRVDASLDLFAIAVPVNDQVYDAGGELRGERLRDHPFSTGVNLGWQFTDFQKLTASYQFRFDHYSADKLTTPGFAIPDSTVTNGFGLAYEYKRKGYALGGNAFTYRRGSWDSWGTGAGFDPDQRSYQKYSASLSKDFFFGLHKIHLNAAYYGGRHLDRFSMYQFGFFDENRIHGVPSAGVRFGELAMLRTGYSFNLFDLYRVDLFLEQALGKDPTRDGAWRNVTGIGLGLNLRTPFGTMLRADLGKSFLPRLYSGSGSFVAQIMVLKPI
ncbi:MAG TPA: sigma-E factor regulatory protein RseB domain-containing protein [Vicinamibacteria bacterium]|nr:sigma-E factor regulatory protein RseB domain-containing protein [Vicinamibacteria bacterium]